MALTRDDILNTLDLPTDLVEVPRWDGEVLVKAMPIANTRYTQFVTGGSKPPKGGISSREEFTRRMIGAVILCALDPDTEEPMFKWSDADLLRDKHWNSVLIVANKAFELAADQAPEDDDADSDDLDDRLAEAFDPDEEADEAPLDGE